MKIHMMRSNYNECFEVDGMKSYTDWKSVIVWDQCQGLPNEHDRYQELTLFVDRMIRSKIGKTAIHRIY
jgi:nitroimidazol reductase NimA-like FMN-containing flavoprotein (pyridoxamine 5'-phosphate oxidase superfamily)